MYFVYALYSSKFGKIYIGYSENPEKRLESHNGELNKGRTKKFQPWELIYTGRCETKTAALIRELNQVLNQYKLGCGFPREPWEKPGDWKPATEDKGFSH